MCSAWTTPGSLCAYSATAGTSRNPPMFEPQWQTHKPTRGAPPRRAGGLHYRLGNVLRLTERADGVDAGARGLERIELRRRAEAVGVKLNAEVAPQLLHCRRHLHADGKDD